MFHFIPSTGTHSFFPTLHSPFCHSPLRHSRSSRVLMAVAEPPTELSDTPKSVKSRRDMKVDVEIQREWIEGGDEPVSEKEVGIRKKFSRVTIRGVDRGGLLADFVDVFQKYKLTMVRVELKRELTGPLGREELGECTKGAILVERQEGGLLREEEVDDLKRDLVETWETEGSKRDGLQLRDHNEHVDTQDMEEMEERMLWNSEDAMLRVDTMHASMYMSLFLTCKNRQGLIEKMFKVVSAIGLDIRMAAFTTYNNEGKYRQDTMYFVDSEGNMPSEEHRLTLFYELYDLIADKKEFESQ